MELTKVFKTSVAQCSSLRGSDDIRGSYELLTSPGQPFWKMILQGLSGGSEDKPVLGSLEVPPSEKREEMSHNQGRQLT